LLIKVGKIISIGYKIVKRINALLEDIKRNPEDSNGLGKPERLKDIIVKNNV
jgi:Txe/YoeB family toxin of Txe-Axe toxin-antitoxin module